MSLPTAADSDDIAAALEAGRVLFAQDCRFVHAAQALDHLLPASGPDG